MQWILIIGDNTLSLNIFEKMCFQDCICKYQSENELQIKYNNEYAIFTIYEDAKNEFEYSEYEEIKRKTKIENLNWIMLKYSNIVILKKIISAPDFPKNLFLYCDGVNLELENVFDKSRII
ncbi:MAG: hypothetical protein MJ211_04820 [Bacteroidales bacterium]|nr:hypothetical protein [Bacteroidales bacterium]